MSARAAWRLEAMGFRRVFRYHPGKLDWIASGLAVEGEWASVPKIGEVARRDVPTCGLAENVGEAARHARESGSDFCLVVNDGNVVLGLLQGNDLGSPGETPVEEAMDPGPITYRPHLFARDAARYMRDQRLLWVLVTDADGRLIGVLFREDAERVADGPHAHSAGGQGPYRG